MSKERPILFDGAMVRAILSGAKTQTRRVAKGVVAMHARTGEALAKLDSAGPRVRCPFGQPGDRLWVRETWAPRALGKWSVLEKHMRPLYRASEDRPEWKGIWRPSIHMPRWACRLVLEITDVRVERLQAISEADAIAEGLTQTEIGGWLPGPCDHPEWAFHQLWNQVYGESAWDSNPWVWVIHLKRVEVSGV